MEPNQLPPNSEVQETADDHLLEDLAAATSLFNPAQLWQREVELEALDEQDAADTTGTVSSETPVT
ncbi:hypothetical protein GCM10028822_06910 [Hymenobacter terrigena]